MSRDDIVAARDRIEARWAMANKKLASCSRSANGLTPDFIKFTPEYRAIKAESDAAFAELRRFNARFAKVIRHARRP